MQRLVMDFIRRHPLSLGFALILSSAWWGTAQETDNYLAFYVMALMVGFGLFGLILDLQKGYLRMAGMLPISTQQIVKSLWFLGVCLGSCLACLAYWIGVLVVVFSRAIMGTPEVPDLRVFPLFCEFCICISAIQWSFIAMTGDPTKKNCSKGLLGCVPALLIIPPLCFPKDLWKALYEVAPVTTIPVILIAGALSYLVTPLILTSGPSLSWPGSLLNPRKKPGIPPIVFPSRQVALLRALINPLLISSLAMGAGSVGWFGMMLLIGFDKHPEGPVQKFGVMMTMMALFAFGIGAGSTGILSGIRVLPVSTIRMALGMTLLPLEAWVSFGFTLALFCMTWGEWSALLGLLPFVILAAGATSLFVAFVFRFEQLVLLYLGGIAVVVLIVFLTNVGLLSLNSWLICLPLAVVSLGLAYVLNRNSLRCKSTLYRPRHILGQVAAQATRWQSGR